MLWPFITLRHSTKWKITWCNFFPWPELNFSANKNIVIDSFQLFRQYVQKKKMTIRSNGNEWSGGANGMRDWEKHKIKIIIFTQKTSTNMKFSNTLKYNCHEHCGCIEWTTTSNGQPNKKKHTNIDKLNVQNLVNELKTKRNQQKKNIIFVYKYTASTTIYTKHE